MTRPGPMSRVLKRRKDELHSRLRKEVKADRKAARERLKAERQAAREAAE
jgi:hypothetical protein